MMENKNQQQFFLVFFTLNNTGRFFTPSSGGFSQWLLADFSRIFYHIFDGVAFLIEEFRALFQSPVLLGFRTQKTSPGFKVVRPLWRKGKGVRLMIMAWQRSHLVTWSEWPCGGRTGGLLRLKAETVT